MSYLVLARKWRPQTFSDLIGQEHVSQTLKNAIDSGRVAHAFLFTGARGVGKTSSARILAKALNCEQGTLPEPCNACSTCAEITAGNSVDVFEIDGASNTGVDDIRELRDNIKYLPSRSRFKIFIIDEVHMLSTSAFNALLKTLEEPPPHVKFIFATTEPHKVPITILSRCQRFDFKRIPLPVIIARLRHIVAEEGIAVSDAALAMVARKGDGSMRDCLSTLDQVLAFCGESVADDEVVALLGVVDRRLLQETAEAVFTKNSPVLLTIVKRVDSFGSSMRHFCQELIEYFRNILLLQAAGEAADLSDLAEGELSGLQTQAKMVPLADVQRHISLLVKAESEMAHSTFPRLIMEMTLIKMATLLPVVPVDQLLERLKILENRFTGGMVASPPPSWQKQAVVRPNRSDSAGEMANVPKQPAPSAPLSAEKKEAPAPAMAPVSSDTPGETRNWPGFVTYIKGRKPMLGTLLEHGRPLNVSDTQLQIGFQSGSFELDNISRPDALEELKKWAQAFWQKEIKVVVTALSGNGENVPLSLAEKKSFETASRLSRMREDASSHPVVSAALEIFEGELASVDEVFSDKQNDVL